jgi:hypothetical protein
MKGSCVLFLLNLKSKFVHLILAQIFRICLKNFCLAKNGLIFVCNPQFKDPLVTSESFSTSE